MRLGFWKLVFKLQSLAASEEGQDLVEFGMMLALISISAISGSHKVATAVNTVFTNISTSLA